MKKRDGRMVVLSALLLALASQISVGLVTGSFNISLAVVLLVVLRFLFPALPVLVAAALAAPGVFLLRCAAQWAGGGTLAGCWAAYAPEMLFYLTYGLLLSLLLRRMSLRPFPLWGCLALVGVDAAANLAELAIRLGTGAFAPAVLGRIVLVGAARSLVAWAAVRGLDSYGIQVLHREEGERYQSLLLMTAALKSEVAWMDKGTALIESTMNEAYRLYSQLRDGGADRKTVDAALTVAKDVHEVKKEYFLLMRGISEALSEESPRDGMNLGELMEIMVRSGERTARAQGKQVVFTANAADNFYTRRHHCLMSIFRNLINNAVEAAGEGEIRIALTEWSEGENCCFQVADNCGGIPQGRLEQIFTPGFSSKINYETGAVNRGLGLAIVRDLVEDSLSGTIQVENRDGGAVFTICVPRERLEGADHAVLSD